MNSCNMKVKSIRALNPFLALIQLCLSCLLWVGNKIPWSRVSEKLPLLLILSISWIIYSLSQQERTNYFGASFEENCYSGKVLEWYFWRYSALENIVTTCGGVRYSSIYPWHGHELEMSGQFHVTAALPLGNETAVRMKSEAQKAPWCFEKKKISCLCCKPNPGWSTIPNTLSWLQVSSNEKKKVKKIGKDMGGNRFHAKNYSFV